jgi:hypothetical protein
VTNYRAKRHAKGVTVLGLVGAVCEIGAVLIVLATVPRRQATLLEPAVGAR